MSRHGYIMTHRSTRVGATGGKIPADQAGYTTAVLSDALGLPVKSFEIQNFGEEGAGGGFAGGVVCRVKDIVYEEVHEKNLPKSLILKWFNMSNSVSNGGAPDTNFLERVLLFSICKLKMDTEEVQRREYDFFGPKSYLRPSIENAGVKIPQCYASDILDFGNPSLCCKVWCNQKTKMRRYMVFEDITDSMAEKYDVAAIQFDESHMSLAVENMAKIHSANWGYSKDQKMASRVHEAYWYACVFGWTTPLRKAKRRYKFSKYANEWKVEREYLNEYRVSEALTRLESFYRNEVSNIVENLDHKQTILHGDYHFANIMFLKNCEDVVMLDWQMYGHGHALYEFCYFLYFVLANDEYVDRSRTFKYLKMYYDKLCELTISVKEEMSWKETQKLFICICFEMYVWVIACYRADIKKRKMRDKENTKDKRMVGVNKALDKRDKHLTLFVVDLMNNLEDYGWTRAF